MRRRLPRSAIILPTLDIFDVFPFSHIVYALTQTELARHLARPTGIEELAGVARLGCNIIECNPP